MSLNSITELTGTSYRLLTKLLINGKRAVPDSSHIPFIKSLERSLPSNYWDLNVDHISVLLYGAARVSSKSSPATRSLCARLCNICEGVVDGTSQDKGVLTSTEEASTRPEIDLRNIVVIAWCLNRLSRRVPNDAQLPRAALCLVPSLIHWVNQAQKALGNGSNSLLDTLPANHYARLCTAFLCMDAIFERCSSMGDNHATIISESQRISKLYLPLISQVLEACLRETVEYKKETSTATSRCYGTSFEETYETHIVSSFKSLIALIARNIPVHDTIQTYWNLLKKMKVSSLRSLEMLVESFALLSDGKLPSEGVTTLSIQLLDEILTRELHELSSKYLYDIINGCALSSIQHLKILDAVSDIIIQRSHRLPNVTWSIKVLESFKSLSYHNPSVLELLVRHVHNNVGNATEEQINTLIECCRALNYSHPIVELLAQSTTT